MIRITDTLLLASTKLKVRKIRLIITLVIGSLLFAVLFFLAFVSTGIVKSLENFGSEGYGNRYLVEVTPRTYSFFDLQYDTDVMNILTAKQKEIIAQKKAAAKKLGLTYTDTEAANDTSLPITAAFPGPNSPPPMPNPGSPIIQSILVPKNTAIKGLSFGDFTSTARAAGATATYRGVRSNNGASFGPFGGGTTMSIQVLVDGKEDLEQAQSSNGPSGPPTGIKTITQIGWSQKDTELLKPFILSGQTASVGTDLSIPVIAPYSAAEEILGLKPLAKTAKPAQKLERQQLLRKDIAGKTAQICYRNGPSADLLQKAVQQQKDIESNKTNKDYVKQQPEYALPATACGPATIKKDARTADEKKAAANQLAFDQQFNPQPEPVQGILTVRIVGLNADVDNGPSVSALGILNGLLRSSLGDGWFSPSEAVAQSPLATTMLGSYDSPDPTNKVFYAQFSSPEQMTAFIDSTQCAAEKSLQFGPQTTQDAYFKVMTGCIQSGKVYLVSPYGNSAAAVQQFKRGIAKAARYVVLVVFVIASIVLMGTIGKIIADSRRETAVFRALGAKRLDIAQIYITYSLLLGSLITVFSLIGGVIGAKLFDQHYSPATSIYAVLSYNSADIDKKFSYFGIDPFYLWVIAVLILAAAFISALLPILTNIRRSPIRDMRDDS